MRFLIVSAYSYWGDFLPTDIDKGDRQIGGGETAMIQVAKNLVELGHEVFVFYDVKRPGKYAGVDYLPTSAFQSFACDLEHEVLVSWDLPQALRLRDRSKVHVVAFQLNDADIGVYDHAVDMYFHPSKWHAERFLRMYPEMTASKVRTRLTNGIDPYRYRKDVKRNPRRVIYSSSPDRGLHHLLRFWPRIRAEVSDAELHVFYDMDKWLGIETMLKNVGLKTPAGERASLVSEVREKGLDGVTFHGGIGQGQLAIEQLQSGVMVYPCDPLQPTEGFSMTCLEAITAGCSLITSDADALPELWADAPNTTLLPLPVDDNVWVDTIVKALVTERLAPVNLGVPHLWRSVARRWETEIVACIQSQSQ